MTLPTAYTESELISFMKKTIGTAAEALGWVTSAGVAADGAFDEAVNDTLLTLGVEDVADYDGVAAIRAVARYHVWSHVVDAAAGLIAHSVDQQSFKLSDVQKQATIALARAEAAVLALPEVIAGTLTVAVAATPSIRVLAVNNRDNPYRREYQAAGARVLP